MTDFERREAMIRELKARAAARTNAAAAPTAAPGAQRFPTTTPAGVAPITTPTVAPGGAPGGLAPGAQPGAGPGAAAGGAGAGAGAGPLGGRVVPVMVPEGDDVLTNLSSMVFPSVDLTTFLDLYASFQRRMILRPATLPAGQITFVVPSGMSMTRREMIEAMDTVLSMNGISTILVGDKFVKVVTTQDALTAAAPVSTLSPTNLPEAGQYLVRICQLKYVKPSVITPLLAPFGKVPNGVVPIEDNGIVVLRDFSENIKRMLEIIERVDVAIPAEFISEVIPIKYAKASEIANALGSLGGGGGGTTIGGSGSGGSMSGGTMGGYGRGTMGGMGGGYGGMGMRNSGGYGSRYGGGYGGGYSPYGDVKPMSADEVQPLAFGTTPVPTAAGAAGAPGASLSDRLRSIINKASGEEIKIIGPNKILADENSNQLLVFAGREDMKTIKEIISKLDTISPQVLIESLILEVGLNDSLSAAFDYAYAKKGNGAIAQITKALPVPPPENIGGFGTNLVSGGLNWFGKIDQNFYYHITAAAQAGRASLLSRPRIQTSHAQPAQFFVGETRPYPTGTSYGGYGGNYSQIQQLNIGVTLSVLPLINQDGLVVLEVQQQVTSYGGSVKIDNVGDVPITKERDASAKISVRSGETIVLGGFISADNSKSDSGVPFLKDLPLVGPLFRATSKSRNRSELIILIRPTVLPNPADAVLAAKDMKSKMPLARTAEVELQEDWEKYQRMADDIEAASAKRKAKEAQKSGGHSKYEFTPTPDLDLYQRPGNTPPTNGVAPTNPDIELPPSVPPATTNAPTAGSGVFSPR